MSDRPGHSPQLVHLRDRAVRGSALSVADQIMRLVLYGITTIILARQLDADDFGLIAVAISLTQLLSVIRDSGLGKALVQRRELEPAHLASVCWFQTLVAAAAAGLVAVTARPIAEWYGKPELASVLWAMTVPIMATALCAVPLAILRRDLRFGRLFVASFGSALIASAVAITAAFMGAGHWSLVLQVVVSATLLCVFSWSLAGWWPRTWISAAALRPLWSFGIFVFFTTLLGYGFSRLDALVIGKLLGVAAAGTFFLAREFSAAPQQMLAEAVSRVMFPAFSAVQDDLGSIRSGFLNGSQAMATFIFPITAGLLCLSADLVPLLLGDTWLPTIPLLQILGLMGVLTCISQPASQVLLARGRSRLEFIIVAVRAVLVLAAFVIGARWGVFGVAVAWIAARLLIVPVTLTCACREIDLSPWRAVGNFWRPALIAALSGAAALGAGWACDTLLGAGSTSRIIIMVSAFVVTYGLGVRALAWGMIQKIRSTGQTRAA